MSASPVWRSVFAAQWLNNLTAAASNQYAAAIDRSSVRVAAAAASKNDDNAPTRIERIII